MAILAVFNSIWFMNTEIFIEIWNSFQMSQDIFLFPPHILQFRNVKTIVLMAVQKQPVGQIWLASYSFLTPGLVVISPTKPSRKQKARWRVTGCINSRKTSWPIYSHTPLPTVCLLQCTQRQAWGRGGGQFVKTAGLGLDISSKNLCMHICLAHLVYSESVIWTCQLKLSQEDSILKSRCNSHCSYVVMFLITA